MSQVEEYLLKDIYSNAYILRAISQQISDFRYHLARDDSGQVVGLVAQWPHEKIATVRGTVEFCFKWFAQLSRDYDFYDIEPSIAYAMENKGLVQRDFKTFRYQVLKTELGSVQLRKADCTLCICKEEFPDTEHLTVSELGKQVSSMDLERVTDRHFILSKFITLPDWRNQGIGTQFLEIVLNRLSGKTVQLFVDAENTKAISFYKRFGFITVGELFNFERIRGS